MPSKTFDPLTAIPPLTSKVILVTGGNTGLGQETILQLARHRPAKLYLAARTESKARTAIDEIKAQVPDANVIFLPLDLTSFDSIAAAANTFKADNDRLDILINNAGIMATPAGTTKEGFEIQLGTNHIGHFLLTKLLLPTMLRTAERVPGADVRIVNLSSEGHMLAPAGGINFAAPELPNHRLFATWRRYGQSKLANMLHAKELARRYPSLTAVSVHPGVIKTNLFLPYQASVPGLTTLMGLVTGLIFQTVPQGARNQLWAATASKSEVQSGPYYTPVGVKAKGSGCANNTKLAERLWEWTEEQVGMHGF
ncbi:MAG: hypothetical protein M1817_003811 [Caeruleum heppii]|nr:MAG: hypothetical protein M1817_003811 [Caeruleum heppii]